MCTCVNTRLHDSDCVAVCILQSVRYSCYIYHWDPCFSAANFAKFCSAVCEILRLYYPQMPYIPQPVGVDILTDSTSKYKEFKYWPKSSSSQ